VMSTYPGPDIAGIQQVVPEIGVPRKYFIVTGARCALWYPQSGPPPRRGRKGWEQTTAGPPGLVPAVVPEWKVMKVPNPLQKIDPDHTWIWIVPILIVVIVAIAAWTGASEVRIEVDSLKVVVDWP
jgi:hypothetical protein